MSRVLRIPSRYQPVLIKLAGQEPVKGAKVP